ncbi:acyltransferase family protein [Paludibaculum fermentans]|uniref:Acyltransferase n=1 Tax=Paludibaculum fermentans TaxID=1473598 RepID=A0A7S7SHM0_PALFE|nr:acyltransferase [Paludibaculum fermentans]QOY85104.1 acyltransferase [Paludibaculum fermentans]
MQARILNSTTAGQSGSNEAEAAPRAPGRASERIVPELNGVRGIAILMVLLLHFGARPEGVPKILTGPFALGWSGVDLFFVLSGFLITGILLDTRWSTNYFSSFYARRALRIFPLYLIAVFAYFHLVLPLAHSRGLWLTSDSSAELWYWLYSANWLGPLGKDNSGLNHLWSLAIEEQYYLVWPAVVFLVKRERMWAVCLGVMTLSFALRIAFVPFNASHPGVLYGFTPFRLEPLALGGLTALAVRNEAWRAKVKRRLGQIAAGGAALLLAVLAITRNPSHDTALMGTAGFTAFGILYACLVFHAYVESGSSSWISTQLRRPFLMSLGMYSYAAYVFHFPISNLQNSLLMELAVPLPVEGKVLLWGASKALGVAVTYGIALLSWHLIEKHFLRLKRHFPAMAPVKGSGVQERRAELAS